MSELTVTNTLLDVADGVIATVKFEIVVGVADERVSVPVLTVWTTCPIFPPPNPVAVPEFTIVAPEGTVNVSPESPIVKAVPLEGLILFTLISLIYTPFILK